jgi:hypothetical protein
MKARKNLHFDNSKLSDHMGKNLKNNYETDSDEYDTNNEDVIFDQSMNNSNSNSNLQRRNNNNDNNNIKESIKVYDNII